MAHWHENGVNKKTGVQISVSLWVPFAIRWMPGIEQRPARPYVLLHTVEIPSITWQKYAKEWVGRSAGEANKGR
jgi:hypothetical protein